MAKYRRFLLQTPIEEGAVDASLLPALERLRNREQGRPEPELNDWEDEIDLDKVLSDTDRATGTGTERLGGRKRKPGRAPTVAAQSSGPDE